MARLVIALVLALGGCVPFIGGREQGRQLATAAQDLVEIAEAQEGEIDWLGLRDPCWCADRGDQGARRLLAVRADEDSSRGGAGRYDWGSGGATRNWWA